MRTKLYGIAVSLFSALIFGYLCVRSFLPSIKSGVNLLRGYRGFIPAALLLLLLWAVSRFVAGKMDRTVCKAAVVFMIAISLTMQIICLIYLRVKPSWDFGAIVDAAARIAAGRPVGDPLYFGNYPFNLNPAVLVGSFQYLVGGSGRAPYILNLFAVTISVAGACLTAWRVFSPKVSVMTALFCLAAAPLYLYIPIVYTDTLSMPFAVWSVYAWSFIRYPGGLSTRLHGLPAYAAVGLLAAAGYLVKPVAAVGLPAFAADYVLANRGYGKLWSQAGSRPAKIVFRLLPPVGALAVFLAAVLSFGAYVDLKGYKERLDPDGRIPYTHWVLMGLNKPFVEGGTSFGYGGFSAADLKLARSFNTPEEREKADLAAIRQRLVEFGFKGYASFLLKKIEWTWTDGTYYATVKLARYPLKLSVLHKFVLSNGGKSNRLFLAFTQVTQGLLLFLLFSGALLLSRCREGDAYRLILVMCLGLLIFLAVWETRSRYLTFMIPLFAVMAASSAERLFAAAEARLAGIWSNKIGRDRV